MTIEERKLREQIIRKLEENGKAALWQAKEMRRQLHEWEVAHGVG